MKLLLIVCVAIIVCGFGSCQTTKPLKPGRGAFKATSGATNAIVQSENPAAESKQNYERTEEKTTTIPAGTVVKETTIVPAADTNQPAKVFTREFSLKDPIVEHSSSTEKNMAQIGASQKDTARDISAKLASMRPVQILGGILVLCALAMFYPPIALITASRTLQAVTGAVGVALLFLPVIVVGHEGILIAAGIGIPAIWFFAHRHGTMSQLAEQAEALFKPTVTTTTTTTPAQFPVPVQPQVTTVTTAPTSVSPPAASP